MKFVSNILIRFSACRFRLFRTLNSVLWAFGIMWLLLEITDYFAPEQWAMTIKPYWWVFLLAGIIVGFVRAQPRTSITQRIANTDVSIEIKVADIFGLPGAIVVGSNTTFDTSIEDGTIDKRSIQGQFTLKYFHDVVQLDQEITRALQGVSYEELAEAEKPYGNQRKYQIGTVASVQARDKKAYFLAIARLNVHRVATSSLENILDALPQLWEHVRSRGGIEPICTPLIGSGFSRAVATRDELAQEIIRSFIAASSEKKFCEKLTIAISPKNFSERKVDLERLRQFLKHACRYTSAVIPSDLRQNVGTPVQISSDSLRFLKATRFLLDDKDDNKDYRSLAEAVRGSLERVVPVLLRSATFDDFIENANAQLQIGDLPREQTPPPDLIRISYRVLSWGKYPVGPRDIASWGVFRNRRVIMNQIAKNHFDEIHSQFRAETMV